MKVTLAEPFQTLDQIATPTPAGWEGILADDEKIIWQGVPDRRFRWEFRSPKAIGTVIAMTFVIVLFGVASPQAERMDISSVALIALCWLIIFAASYHLYVFWNRRRTFYTLSNKRGFIATMHWGVPNLKSYKISTSFDLRLVDTEPGAVYFAREAVPERYRFDRINETEVGVLNTLKDVGFTDIANARTVYEMLYKLRETEK